VRVSRARLRRATRRETIGVDIGAALNLTGVMIASLSTTFVVPITVALIYGEPVWPFAVAAGVTAAVGLLIAVPTRGGEHVGAREAFVVVPLTWAAAAGSGALAYLLSGEPQLARPVDAYFEAMSGFTTTGATVLTDIEALSRSVAMWRQFTQWLGGMGIIVLALAILPRLRVGGRQLFEAEAPGTETQNLTASIRETARRVWLLYIALTVVLAAGLVLLGVSGIDSKMDPFRAIAHAFTTMPTGGFSTEGRGMEVFSAQTQWLVTAFMVIAGLNFALLYAAFLRGQVRPLFQDEEIRLYLLLLAFGSTILALEVLSADILTLKEGAIRHAVFQAVSSMTSTGYASADYNEWTSLAAVTIIGLMFIGGSAGSTAGSVKVVRHLLVAKILRRELEQTVHPEVVSVIRLNGRVVEERTVRSIITFVLIYIGLFILGAFLITISQSFGGEPTTPFEAAAAAATTIGNVGPGVGFAGPMGSFDPFSDFSKAVMIALMWIGRLELLTVIVLFTRQYWRA
jgi:trk system potassium uptake protein TrkH